MILQSVLGSDFTKIDPEKYHRSEANLQAIFENTNTAFHLFDHNYNLVAFNKQAYKWTLEEGGKKLEVGKNFTYYIDNSKLPFFRTRYLEAMKGKEVVCELKGKATNRFYKISIKGIKDKNGESCGFCISSIDISDQRQAELAIRESESMYKYLFNNSPVLKWVCDKRSFKIFEANDTAITHYGYTREEFLKMSAFDLRVKEEHHMLTEVMNLGPEKLNNNISTHKKKNGTTIRVSVSLHEIIFKGEPAYLVVATDVTESLRLQKKLEDEIIRRQVEITKATIHIQERERMEIGRELHDNVNQLLATVNLYLTASDTNLEKKQQYIENAKNLVLEAIQEIRRISKELVPPSLGDLTLKTALIQLTEPVLITGAKVKLRLTGLNENKLREDLKISVFRIVQEQLNNILKYAQASEIHIHLIQKNKTLELSVKDNGLGFDVNEKRKGIGISNIINRANTFYGVANFDSAPGKGCRLNVIFNLQPI